MHTLEGAVCAHWQLKFQHFPAWLLRQHRYGCSTIETINQNQGVTDETFFCKPYVNYTVACDLDDGDAHSDTG